MTAGPWLRALAVASAVATGMVVATGEHALAHRATALVALALLVGVAASGRLAHRNRRRLAGSAGLALGVYLLQIGLGGIVAATGSPPWARWLHLAFGGLSLAAAVAAAAEVFRSGQPVARGSWRDYVTLTKPRIMTLLLLTAAGGAFVGAEGVPSTGILAATLGGLALACGGASALNHVLDRDIDRLMGKRTEMRPVAAGRIPPERALEFGLALSALSFAVLASFANVLAALLAVFGNLFYVLVYTRWLKRATPQNIVIGGAAGAVPPVVGYAAVTGNLALPALMLFAIVFLWTPPHFWALALLIRGNYEAAGVPMLPVARGEAATARSIVRYAAVLVAATVAPFFLGELGVPYLVAALLLGALFVALSLPLARAVTPARARRLFTFSLAYLALLFVAMALDPLLG